MGPSRTPSIDSRAVQTDDMISASPEHPRRSHRVSSPKRGTMQSQRSTPTDSGRICRCVEYWLNWISIEKTIYLQINKKISELRSNIYSLYSICMKMNYYTKLQFCVVWVLYMRLSIQLYNLVKATKKNRISLDRRLIYCNQSLDELWFWSGWLHI